MKNYLITNSNDPCYPILQDLEARQFTKSDFAKMTGFKKQTLGRWLSAMIILKLSSGGDYESLGNESARV